MTSHYYANGKLLISGEYLVLKGASALVVPLKIGQHMKVTPTGCAHDATISWEANVLDEPWFSAEIIIRNWEIKYTTDNNIAGKLVRIFQEALKMNRLLFVPEMGFEMVTNTGFNMDWGFGSSSALVANIAQWAMVDPFELYFRTFGGSGADVAAAISAGPILYKLVKQKPEFHSVSFKPSFYSKLWLVYLGHKQNSLQSIHDFTLNGKANESHVAIVDKITFGIIQAESLDSFKQLIRQHERIISGILGVPSIKESMFIDFPGEVKSLGAWGGDFILAVSEERAEFVKKYFEIKGLFPVFSFEEIVMV